MVVPTWSFPSFTICTILLPLLPIMVFIEVVFGRGFREYEQFFDLFFMGFCCQVVFCIIVQLRWIPPMEIPTRIKYMRLLMLALLLVLIIELVAVFHVLFSEPDQSYKYMIAAYIVVICGGLPILISFCMTKLSGSLFHTTDYLEWFYVIFGLLFCFPVDLVCQRDRRALFILFTPMYFLILKGVYSVWFNSNEFIFFHEEDKFVMCKTWCGAEYRGRVSGFRPLTFLELQEVEVYKNGQRVDSQDKVHLKLITLKHVQHIQQPGLMH